MKRKVAESLLIREITPTLSIQGQSVPLQLLVVSMTLHNLF